MKRTAAKKQSLNTYVQAVSTLRNRVVDMSERHIYPNSSLSKLLRSSSEPKLRAGVLLEEQNPIPHSEETLSEMLLKALKRDPSMVLAGGRVIDIPE